MTSIVTNKLYLNSITLHFNQLRRFNKNNFNFYEDMFLLVRGDAIPPQTPLLLFVSISLSKN